LYLAPTRIDRRITTAVNLVRLRQPKQQIERMRKRI